MFFKLPCEKDKNGNTFQPILNSQYVVGIKVFQIASSDKNDWRGEKIISIHMEDGKVHTYSTLDKGFNTESFERLWDKIHSL